MASENLQIDNNGRNVTGGVTNDVNEYIKNLRVNPSTGRLLVDAHLTSTNTQISDTIPGGTAGSVLFLDIGSTLAEDNTHFFYDSTNHFLGIGTDTPADTVHVVGGFRYVDGNQTADYVLVSDGNGTGTWQDLANNSTFITNLVANNTFTTNLANNSNFYTTLSNNNSFVTNLTNNATFISNITTITTTTGAIIVQDEGVPLATAAGVLNFVGAGVTATGSGNTKTITIPGGGSSIFLEVNGTPNGDQTLLNLIQGTNITLTDDGVGGVTIAAPGAAGAGTIYVDASDTTPDFLDPKINIHSSDASVTVTKTITNPAGNEILDYDLTTSGGGSGSGGGASIFTRSKAGGVGSNSSLSFALGQDGYVATTGTIGAASTDAYNVIPDAGTIKKLYIDTTGGNSFDNNTIFTLFKNGMATSVTVTVAAGVAAITSDTVNSFSVVAGDVINLYFDTSASSTGNGSLNFSYEFTSTSGGSGGSQIDQTPLGTGSTYGLVAGAVDGMNTIFTVSLGSYTSGKLQVFRNGVERLQGSGEEWVETTPASGTFTFNVAPLMGDIITVVYGGSGGSGTGNSVTETFALANAFSVGQVVTNAGGTDNNFGLSDASTPATAEVVGIISAATGGSFTILSEGYMNLASFSGNIAGAVAGDILFLDDMNPGGLTLTEPTTGTTVSKPLAQVIDASTFLIYFHNYRGQNNQTIPAGTMLYSNGTTTKNAADASTVQNIAHGLGVIPKMVRIEMIYENTSTSGLITAIARTRYNGTTQSSQSTYIVSGGSTNDNTFRLNGTINGNVFNQGVVTFDATNIIITWTSTPTAGGVYQLLWEAEGQS